MATHGMWFKRMMLILAASMLVACGEQAGGGEKPGVAGDSPEKPFREMFERSLAGDLKVSLASLYNSEKYDISQKPEEEIKKMAAEIKAEAEKIQAAGGLKIEVLAQAKLDAEGLVEEGEYALLHLTQGDKETTGFARKQDGVWKVYLPGMDETQLGEALEALQAKP